MRSYVWNGSTFVEKSSSKRKNLHFVQGDLAEFTANDGKRIGGRRQFREHLKENGLMEFGAKDLEASREQWNQRQLDNQRELKEGEKYARPVEAPDGPIEPYQRSALNREVAMRLDGRPRPTLQESIKLSLEVGRMLRGR